MRAIRLFVILAIVCGVGLNLGAQQEPSFNISSSETYYPGQKSHIAVWATGVSALEFRVYSVNDPIKFFGQLQEQHQFGGQGPRIAHERTWLEEFHDWKHERWAEVRDVIRAQFDSDARASIRQWRLQQHVRSVSTGETYAQVPLLNAQQLVSAWRWSSPRGQYRLAIGYCCDSGKRCGRVSNRGDRRQPACLHGCNGHRDRGDHQEFTRTVDQLRRRSQIGRADSQSHGDGVGRQATDRRR